MKKISIIIICLIFCNVVKSQESRMIIGLDLQPAISTFYGSDITSDYRSLFSVTGGINFEYLLTDKFSLKSGLYYDQKNSSANVLEESIEPGTYYSENVNFYFNYLSIPFLVSISSQGKCKLFIDAGLVIGYFMNGKLVINGFYNGYGQRIINTTNDFSRIDVGASLGIGLNIPIYNKFVGSIEIKDNNSLFNIVKGSNNGTIRNNLFTILVGLKMKI